MNATAWLEVEIFYYDFKIQYVNHCTMETENKLHQRVASQSESLKDKIENVLEKSRKKSR